MVSDALNTNSEIKQFTFQEVGSDDNQEGVISVQANLEDSREKVEAEVLEILKSKFWFLKEYWKNKKIKEKLNVTFGAHTLDIYNFGNSLNDSQLAAVAKAIKDYSQLSTGVFDKLTTIVFDNNQPINENTGGPTNGRGGLIDGVIKIYPAASESVAHRIGGVSNLEGTLIHELSHSISTDFLNEWEKRFGWKELPEPKNLPGGGKKIKIPIDPKRCVTEYAQINPREDICESMVAAIRNPKILDPEKLQFIRDSFFSKNTTASSVVTRRSDNLNFPPIPQPVKFKRIAKKKFEISNKKKE